MRTKNYKGNDLVEALRNAIDLDTIAEMMMEQEDGYDTIVYECDIVDEGKKVGYLEAEINYYLDRTYKPVHTYIDEQTITYTGADGEAHDMTDDLGIADEDLIKIINYKTTWQ